MDLVLQPTDLGALVKRVIAEYRIEWESQGQQVDLFVEPGLPDALCDQTRASQIVGNLMSNAIKYSREGGRIAVRVGAAEVSGYLLLSVTDSGTGISEEDQVGLFQRFYRTREARKSAAGGTGLGLYITRSLVELHGGAIWLDSQAGVGSTFHVTFVGADA
jgi:signal transduction histidine kinase